MFLNFWSYMYLLLPCNNQFLPAWSLFPLKIFTPHWIRRLGNMGANLNKFSLFDHAILVTSDASFWEKAVWNFNDRVAFTCSWESKEIHCSCLYWPSDPYVLRCNIDCYLSAFLPFSVCTGFVHLNLLRII